MAMYEFSTADGVVGPVDGLVIPRYAGPHTFARLPRIDQVTDYDVAVVGVPFDTGTTYRPGARFGPEAIRAGSRLLRRYHPHMDSEPFHDQQVVDAGDIACNPFDLEGAMDTVDRTATNLIEPGTKLVTLGGDHTIALPLLRTMRRAHGPVALVHFDAHLDTWDSYFGSNLTHGTPFRRAFEEGLYVPDHSMHVGIRGPVSNRRDLIDDAAMGFSIIGTWETEEIGVAGLVEKIRERVDGYPVYLSIDIDVLDPAFAPGTGTPEIGGFSTRELASIIRGLSGLPIVGLDVVEVSPAYDHAEITAMAAANLAYDVISLMAAAGH
jgi:agmatinase